LRHVKLVRTLGSIAERQYETRDERGQVEKLEDDGQDIARRKFQTAIGEGSGQDTENKEEVTLMNISTVHLVRRTLRLTIANQANSMLINW